MTGYTLKIIGQGRYSREAILSIQDINSQKRNWSTNDIKTVIEPIYAVGEFPTYNPRTKTKRIPYILRTPTFEKILALIVEDKIRYIETIINGWNITFYTRNPESYKYEYYLKFSKDTPITIPKIN